jgi:hypothetical protein
MISDIQVRHQNDLGTKFYWMDRSHLHNSDFWTHDHDPSQSKSFGKIAVIWLWTVRFRYFRLFLNFIIFTVRKLRIHKNWILIIIENDVSQIANPFICQIRLLANANIHGRDAHTVYLSSIVEHFLDSSWNFRIRKFCFRPSGISIWSPCMPDANNLASIRENCFGENLGTNTKHSVLKKIHLKKNTMF